ACLDSLRHQTFRDFETVIVDNGSRDGSHEFCAGRSPGVKVIALPRNEGFAVAVNTGISSSGSELVALLNNDTEAHPRWLEALAGAADRRPDIAFFASKMIDFNDRMRFDSAGNCYAFNGRSIPRGFLAPDTGQYETEEEVFGACAGAALYRRSLFTQVGLFDETFVSYKEDVDLDFRARLHGLRCLYVPAAVCYHRGGATTGRRKSDLAVRLSTRNSIITFIKNMPLALMPRALPLMMCDLLLQAGYQFLKGSQAGPLLGGISSAIPRLSHALSARRQIQRGACVDLRHLERLLREGDAEVVRYRTRCREAGVR
ncbi:MAG: glycosyltransferase family 2 protein, partial [Candidatus Aureabacteria bacterium]|nr:glycosyltransferase family 2 protein [Candidatus Auribacterota bacterium]